MNTIDHPIRVNLQLAIDEAANIPSEHEFTEWVNAAMNATDRSWPADACVTIRIVGAAEITRLNTDFRSADRATNVLAFPAGQPQLPDGEPVEPEIGDVVLCHEVVVREAGEQDKTVQAHFAHLAVHGALHLAGYDHLDNTEAAAMEALESQVLAGAGYADPYRSTDD